MRAVIFDFNRTLREHKEEKLLPHAYETLVELKKKGYLLYLLSRKEGDRANLLDLLGINDFFDKIFFVEDKNPETFKEVLACLPAGLEEVFVVGDHRHEEIRLGNSFGLRTIWLKRGEFANLPEKNAFDAPWKTIVDLEEIREIL
ncbi:MAG: hypothetical protein ABA06_01810 [Parcubacteria bacterium C7867-001]|nr:MAG: hypothetical protein ABA06_01810 [Parcubacteria bacterium C7867-001]